MRDAERSLGRGDLKAGEDAQQRAVEAMQDVTKRLEEKARRLREEEKQVRDRLAEAQRRLEDRAAKAAKEAAALKPKAEDAARAAAEAAEALRRAEERMAKAAESMSGGDTSAASGRQSSASEALEQAEDALAKAAEETGDDRDARRRLKELKAEQDENRRKLKELEDLLKKAENPQASASAQSADQKMDDASRQMDAGSGENASKSAEEARRYLEQLRQDLEREKRRYESLRQEEMLFRLVRDLKEFETEQRRIRDATKELSDAAALNPLARPQKIQLRGLGADQERLKGRVDERAKAVQEEGSTAFARALLNLRADMTEIARLLQSSQLGPFVLGLEDEVLHALGDLIGGFTDEIQRRQQEDQGQGDPPEGGQQGKPPLVPPIVEIKLLRRLQQDVNLKLQNFWAQNPGAREGRMDDAQRRLLERLYHEQGGLAEDLEKLIETVFRGQGR
jgi:hypothetical protein